jgi:hypothetical protein
MKKNKKHRSFVTGAIAVAVIGVSVILLVLQGMVDEYKKEKLKTS